MPFRVEGRVPAGDLVVPVEWMAKRGWSPAVAAMTGLRIRVSRMRVAIKTWWVRRRESLEFLAAVEHRLEQQAWEWVWILLVGLSIFAALVW